MSSFISPQDRRASERPSAFRRSSEYVLEKNHRSSSSRNNRQQALPSGYVQSETGNYVIDHHPNYRDSETRGYFNDNYQQSVSTRRRSKSTKDDQRHGSAKGIHASPAALPEQAYDSDSLYTDDDSVDVQVHSYYEPAAAQHDASYLTPAQPPLVQEFQTVCNPEHPKSVTVHLELPISHDLDAELEELARLRRIGDFKSAQQFFQHNLNEHLTIPYVFVQYAELLLDMGDYKSFGSLDPAAALGTGITSIAQLLESDRTLGDRQGLMGPRPRIRYQQQPNGHQSVPGFSADGVQRVRWADDVRSQNGRRNEANGDLNDDFAPGDTATLGRDRYLPVSPSPIISTRSWNLIRTEKLDELQLLGLNWKLLSTLAQIHRDGLLDEADLLAGRILRQVRFGPDIGSTEIQIISLTLRLCGYIKNCLPDVFLANLKLSLGKWVDYSGLYKTLLSEDRVWDFRDIVCAAYSVYGTKHWQRFTRGQTIEMEIIRGFAHDLDEVAVLALLDLLVSVTLESDSTADTQPATNDSSPSAHFLAEVIMKKFPDAMRSRSYVRWLLTKAAENHPENHPGQESRELDSFPELFRHLESFQGMPFFRKDWITLPVYVPKDSEIPGWRVPDVPLETTEPIQMVLKLAQEMSDYPTQALCYKLLILKSQDPKTLFHDLGHLQKTVQGDIDGFLQTCLSSYIGCTTAESQRKLLDELNSFETWDDESKIRDPEMYWAKDFMQRALRLKLDRRHRQPPLSASHMAYYSWLPTHAREFVNEALGIDRRTEIPRQTAPRPIIIHNWNQSYSTDDSDTPSLRGHSSNELDRERRRSQSRAAPTVDPDSRNKVVVPQNHSPPGEASKQGEKGGKGFATPSDLQIVPSNRRSTVGASPILKVPPASRAREAIQRMGRYHYRSKESETHEAEWPQNTNFVPPSLRENSSSQVLKGGFVLEPPAGLGDEDIDVEIREPAPPDAESNTQPGGATEAPALSAQETAQDRPRVYLSKDEGETTKKGTEDHNPGPENEEVDEWSWSLKPSRSKTKKPRSTVRAERIDGLAGEPRNISTDSTGIWEAWEASTGSKRTNTRDLESQQMATVSTDDEELRAISKKEARFSDVSKPGSAGSQHAPKTEAKNKVHEEPEDDVVSDNHVSSWTRTPQLLQDTTSRLNGEREEQSSLPGVKKVPLDDGNGIELIGEESLGQQAIVSGEGAANSRTEIDETGDPAETRRTPGREPNRPSAPVDQEFPDRILFRRPTVDDVSDSGERKSQG